MDESVQQLLDNQTNKESLTTRPTTTNDTVRIPIQDINSEANVSELSEEQKELELKLKYEKELELKRQQQIEEEILKLKVDEFVEQDSMMRIKIK